MCSEPLYAIRLKTEYDEKFKRFGKRTPIRVLCAVRDIGKETDKLDFNRNMYDLIMISCGQCMQCRLLRVKQRSVMCMCESLEHKDNSFITLTFGYPQTYSYYRHKKGLSHYLSAKKAHFHEWSLETDTVQKFMKRLRSWYYNFQLHTYLVSLGRLDLVFRKVNDNSDVGYHFVAKSHIRIPASERSFLLKDFHPKSIRFMHCGEYGEKKSRSHHHLILFGFQFPDLSPVYENGTTYYTSEILSKLWTFGIHRIGECTYNSCAYVARYVTKKVVGNGSEQYYNGRKPEYITYSTKPVLGANYFKKNYKEISNTNRLSVITDKKYECFMPKSYMNILKDLDLDLYNSVKEQRVQDCLTDLDKLLKQKRSIYSKLDSANSIALQTVRKLVRTFEQQINVLSPEIIRKAKAFGVNVKLLSGEYSENAINYLSSKTFKDHISYSSNKDTRFLYYLFELQRKRLINNCYNLHWSDEKVYTKIDYYLKLENPFKVDRRGLRVLDSESIDNDVYINEKGETYEY